MFGPVQRIKLRHGRDKMNSKPAILIVIFVQD
jgi:hypothetical protein